MAKIFLGQSVTGEDRKKLIDESEQIRNVLAKKGHELIYVVNYPPEILKLPKKKRLSNYAFSKIDECDSYLAVIRTGRKSEGLLIEVGHILDKNTNFYVAIQRGVKNTYLPEIADKAFEFNGFDNLLSKLERMVF